MPDKPTQTAQTDFFESFEMIPLDNSGDGDITTDVSSAHLGGDEPSEEKGPDDLQEDFPFMEDIRGDFVPEPSELQRQFEAIQPARTLRIGGITRDRDPILILADRRPGDFTEDDEDWGFRIH